MSNLSQANGKDNVADHPIVQQLQRDVAQIKRELPDHQLRAISSVTFIDRTDRQLKALAADMEALKEMVKVVIEQSNRILQRLEP